MAPLLFTQSTEIDASADGEVRKKLALLDTTLGVTEYVSGTLMSIADLALLASVSFLDIIDYDMTDYANIATWREKLAFEIPCHQKINVEPIEQFKVWYQTKKDMVTDEADQNQDGEVDDE